MRASVIDFIHRQHLFRGNSGDSHLPISAASSFSFASPTRQLIPTSTPDEISVSFREERAEARGINWRYYSCNWQSRGNFWLVWNSFLRLYYDHLSFLTFRPCFRVDDPDGEFLRYYRS
jgi:hypothetical protein